MTMKKATILLSLITFSLFSDIPQNYNPFSSDFELESQSNKKGTIYVRAMAHSEPIDLKLPFPGIGVGYRFSFDHSGIDISMNYSEGQGSKQKAALWTTPRVSYLYYLNPQNTQSLYLGFGMGWGGSQLKYKKETVYENSIMIEEMQSEFLGLISNATLGYEFLRHNMIISFIELNISQPTVPNNMSGKMPTPFAEISVGAGF